MKLSLSEVLRLVIIPLSLFCLFIFNTAPIFAAIPPGTIVFRPGVNPRQLWTDSGIDVDQYSVVNIKTEGIANGGSIYVPGFFNYDIYGNQRFNISIYGVWPGNCMPTSSYLLPSANCWSLIGSINMQNPFKVGAMLNPVGSMYSFVPTVAGRLYFAANSYTGYNLSQINGAWGVVVIRNQSPAPTPTPSPSPKTPLILIPGIGGSELKVNENTNWSKDNGHGGIFNYNYLENEKVWVNETKAILPGDDDYFDILKMKPDGITSEANIGLTGNLYSGAYQETINFFTSNGYTLNQDLFIFPYDWRKDISLTAELLSQRINQIKQQTQALKVDILAHSMGGLVSRKYISDPINAQNVRKLFTLGTPHLGAVEFIKAIRYGVCFVEVGPFCPVLSPSEIQDVVQNMISGFQLAPSQTYFNFYSGEDNLHPYPYQTENGALNYSQIKNLLTSFGHNTVLFNQAEALHNLDNSLANTNGVEVNIIVGSGIQTLGQIIEKTITTLDGKQIVYKDKIDINGDGTVPLLSAAISDSHKGLFLNGSAQVFFANQVHRKLITNNSTLTLIKNIINGNNQIPNEISTTPFKLSGYSLSVHSPVNMHVYDASGNHTGILPNGVFETNIPGSSYDTLGDAKFIYLPENGIYDIKFESLDNGSFDFKIRKFTDNENTQTILYKEIPLTNSTQAETIFNTESNQTPIIQVDENGDNIVDSNIERFSILNDDASFDFTAPIVSFEIDPTTIWPPNSKMIDIKITGNISDQNPYLFKILVEDEYDLIKPEITIQNQTNINQTIQLQASRKEEDLDGRKYTIKILATDLAGNTSIASSEVIVSHDQRIKK